MEKYLIAIKRSRAVPHYSMISVYSDPLKETVYHSTIAGGDILNFFEDLQIPRRGSSVKVSKGHPVFIELKNLGFAVVEV